MMPDEYDYIIIFFLKKPQTQNYKFVLIIKKLPEIFRSYCLYFQTKPYVIQCDRMNVKFSIYRTILDFETTKIDSIKLAGSNDPQKRILKRI